MDTTPHELFGIIGHPLGHSLSPLLFNSLFAEQGRTALYVPWDVAPGRVKDFVSAVRLLRIRGVSVTIPHKREVVACLDRLSERARAAGAVNTLYWDGDLLCGDNADIPGFLTPLEEMGHKPRRALVMGNGGAARAVLAGLRECGAQVYLSGRSLEKITPLAQEFGARPLPWDERVRVDELDVDTLINATPVGMQGLSEKDSPFPAKSFGSAKNRDGQPRLAYDLIYRPRPTRFLREAAAAGWKTQDGLAMLVGQAHIAFGRWTGEDWPSDMTTKLSGKLAAALDAKS